MEFKIFQALGKIEIVEMEKEINDWMSNEPSTLNVKHTNSVVAGVGEGRGEIYQAVIVSIWYDYSN